MIPVTEANRLISGLNRIAEGVSALAGVIEDAAWAGIEDHYALSGPRPIAAVQLHQPSFEAAAQDQPALPVQATPTPAVPQDDASAPDTQVEAATVVVSLEQVRAVLAELSQAGLTQKLRDGEPLGGGRVSASSDFGDPSGAGDDFLN